ncbi:MAG: glycosyltransferase [Candidatus Kapabacteria bacterium]|nr:glycosyltransferase [Candidatus Kapabacteria bacterium]
MKYSIIVAVFNRPDELGELLESLALQTYRDFEVVIVEDGSSVPSKDVCDGYTTRLKLSYYVKPNSGPGPSRNYGCRRASGDYFIFLDSDCTVPEGYMQAIDTAVVEQQLDAFGGPDREHESFTPTQKAISYSMTSLLTTGGIRGSKVRVGGAFHPRSFNMGISREIFNDTEGFSTMRFGEDVEFSIRMMGRGYRVSLIPDAWVYHKRRTDLKKFFKQVHNSGIARINITLRHPHTLKVTHFFPAAFTVYLLFALVFALSQAQGTIAMALPALYTALLFLEGSIKYRNPLLGLQCVAASYVQLIGYGSGFIRGVIWRIIMNKPEQGAFEKTFYK